MNKKGYTLIEILVAISIFLIVIVAPTGLFVGSFKSQRKALSTQILIDNVSYNLEYINRALRMAKKDLAGNCIEKGSNYENPGNSISRIRFLNYNGYCQEFLLYNERLGVKISTDEDEESLGEFLPLTSNDLKIESVKFQLFGQEQGDIFQPQATISLKIKGKGLSPELQPEIKIQTTITQRNLDVTY